jgi:hypothetical protein
MIIKATKIRKFLFPCGFFVVFLDAADRGKGNFFEVKIPRSVVQASNGKTEGSPHSRS